MLNSSQLRKWIKNAQLAEAFKPFLCKLCKKGETGHKGKLRIKLEAIKDMD